MYSYCVNLPHSLLSLFFFFFVMNFIKSITVVANTRKRNGEGFRVIYIMIKYLFYTSSYTPDESVIIYLKKLIHIKSTVLRCFASVLPFSFFVAPSYFLILFNTNIMRSNIIKRHSMLEVFIVIMTQRFWLLLLFNVYSVWLWVSGKSRWLDVQNAKVDNVLHRFCHVVL